MRMCDSSAVSIKCVAQTLAGSINVLQYVDDILVYGSMQQEHDTALDKLLAALAQKDFRLNLAKCKININSVTFLGHCIDSTGVHPCTDRLASLCDASTLTNIKGLLSFLSAVNYIANFIPNLAAHAKPLCLLTHAGKKFVWSHKQQVAFKNLKTIINDQLQLAIFDPNALTFVTVDISDVSLRAMMSQTINNREIPVQSASHTLNEQEHKYAINEKEGLTCVWSIEHWEKYLLGWKFMLHTDHASLKTLLQQYVNSRISAKFERWLEWLSQFHFEIQHVKGSRNFIPDMFSHLPIASTNLEPAYYWMIKACHCTTLCTPCQQAQ